MERLRRTSRPGRSTRGRTALRQTGRLAAAAYRFRKAQPNQEPVTIGAVNPRAGIPPRGPVPPAPHRSVSVSTRPARFGCLEPPVSLRSAAEPPAVARRADQSGAFSSSPPRWKPAGVCIQELATMIQSAEKCAPSATRQVAKQCSFGPTLFHPKSRTARNPDSRKKAKIPTAANALPNPSPT